MSEMHRTSFEDFDLEVVVTDGGAVEVEFRHPDGEHHLGMTWETFLEAVEFAAKHGKDMTLPALVEFSETLEGAAA